MSIVDRPSRAGLIARVQNILLRPGPEWDVIDTESATVPGLFVGYACILAAIPLIATILQHLLFVHWMMIPSIVISVVSYFFSLLGVFILGFIIDALAPTFEGQKNLTQAMKLAVYPYTAVWVASVLDIIPFLGILVFIAGLYGLYILYLGLPKLMRSPQAKTAGYFIVSVVVAIIVNIVIASIIGAITVMMAAGAVIGGATALSAAGIHGGDFAQIAAASKQLAATAAATGAGAAPGDADGKPVVAIDPARFKAMLPDTVGGMPRTESSSTSAAPGGMSASNAEAVYSQGDQRITLTVTDMGAMGAVTRLAGIMSVQSDKQTPTGYERVGKVNGRLTSEQWDSSSKTGKFGVLVAERVMVQAEGSGVTMDDLKSAVALVGPDRVEQIVKG